MKKFTRARTAGRVVCRCDCFVETAVFERTDFGDGIDDFALSIQDARTIRDNGPIMARIKLALAVLFKKPLYYAEVTFQDKEKWRVFLEDCIKLLDVEQKQGD
jgi:hypothetical protein